MKLIINHALTVESISSEQRLKIVTDNTFENPARFSAIRAGRYHRHIPENICTYNKEDESLVISRGYLQQLFENFPAAQWDIQDTRTRSPHDHYPTLNVALRSYQQRALQAALDADQGIIESPTGSGKTIIGLSLLCERKQRALLLVHSKELALQWSATIKKLMGTEPGLIGNGQWKEGEHITVAMLQTLQRRSAQTKTLGTHYGLVLTDEAHHIPAQTFANVMNLLPCYYRYGLTATPHRRDGLTDLIHRAIGENLIAISPNEVSKMGGIVPTTIRPIYTGFNPGELDGWADYIAALTEDVNRNTKIIAIAQGTMGKMPVLILTDRIKHAERLSDIAAGGDIDHILVHGQLPHQDRSIAMQQMLTHNLTIGTCGLLGEGMDVSRWSALILATPISSKVKLVQAIGRVSRPHEGKTCGYVADLIDDCRFSSASYRKRLAIYYERNFKVLAAT